MLIFSNKNPKLSKCFADHHSDVVTCFEKFEQFFQTLFSENADTIKLQSLKMEIDGSEAAADHELRHVVDMLSDSFLPTTRSNIITLVSSADEVANICQEIVRRIMLEKIQLPSCIHADILQIITITKDQLDMIYTAMDLLINDFKKIYKDRKVLDDVRAEESKVDNIEAVLHGRIFDLDLPLAEKVYYRNMLEHICDLSDVIEDISDKIQVMLVEREG